jgi:hypothetical protein
MSVCCEGRVFSGRGLYVGMIICSGESCRNCVASDSDFETSAMRRPSSTSAVEALKKNKK